MFSVVMPLWNKRPYVRAAVESVLAQSYGDFELIIVDDGSTDASLAALDGIADPRIVILRQANRGCGPARNRGMAAARHAWIAFIDADDLWLPEHLAELDRIRARYPSAGLIGTAFGYREPSGRDRFPRPRGADIGLIDYFDSAALDAPLCASSAAVSREARQALGDFAPAWSGQDKEYWARIALERPVAVSRRATALYRRGTGGITDLKRRLKMRPPLRNLRDVDASVALLVERYPSIRCPQLRRSVERYIDGHVQMRLRYAALVGDFAALRALPRIWRRPPPLIDRLLLLVALLPDPAARGLFRWGASLKMFHQRLVQRSSA